MNRGSSCGLQLRFASPWGTTYWMVRDENSNAGKGHFAMLMGAKLAAKAVAIQGSNACTRWVDGEDIEYVRILD